MFRNRKKNEDQSVELANQEQKIDDLKALQIEEKKLHNLQIKMQIIAAFAIPVVCVVLKEALVSCFGNHAKHTTSNNYFLTIEKEESVDEDVG